jgi:hypothetical protein
VPAGRLVAAVTFFVFAEMDEDSLARREVFIVTNLAPLTIVLEEAIARAVRLRAAKESISATEVVNELLRKALAAEIEEAAGLPALATMIQDHHNREQGALRSPNKIARKE